MKTPPTTRAGARAVIEHLVEWDEDGSTETHHYLATLLRSPVRAERYHWAEREGGLRAALFVRYNLRRAAAVFNIGTLDPSAVSRTGDQMRTAEFDADQLELLIVAAFELLGKPQGEAQELARSILRAAEQPQSGDPEPPNLDPT
jgi:hypothetical protein